MGKKKWMFKSVTAIDLSYHSKPIDLADDEISWLFSIDKKSLYIYPIQYTVPAKVEPKLSFLHRKQ